MASVTQLGYLGLNVKALADWERFATEILGLQSSGIGGDGSLYLRMDENHHRFILRQNDADDVAFIGWEVSDEPALHALTMQLEAAGVEVAAGSPELARDRGVAELIDRYRGSSLTRDVRRPSRHIAPCGIAKSMARKKTENGD